MASRRCGYAGGCLSCFSGRRRGRTSCTQKAARFWAQEKKTKSRTTIRVGAASAARVGPATRGGEDGVDPWIRAPVDGFDVHLQAVSTRRSMAALLADERLFSPMLGSLVHAQLRTSQEGFRTLGTLQNISGNTHIVRWLKVCVPPVGNGKRLTACGFGWPWAFIMWRVKLFLRINCSGQMQHCKKRGGVRGVWAGCCCDGEGRLYLVGHVTSVRDDVQPQLLFPFKRGRAGNTGVLLRHKHGFSLFKRS